MQKLRGKNSIACLRNRMVGMLCEGVVQMAVKRLLGHEKEFRFYFNGDRKSLMAF